MVKGKRRFPLTRRNRREVYLILRDGRTQKTGTKIVDLQPGEKNAATRFASIENSTLRLPDDGLFARGAEAGRAWTGGYTCQVSREVSAGSGSDRNRAQLGSWVCLSNLGPPPGARGGTAQPADGRSQPAGRARTGAVADVGSAGLASGCERAGSRSAARLGEAGSIELGGAGATCAAAGRRRTAKGRSSHTAG